MKQQLYRLEKTLQGGSNLAKEGIFNQNQRSPQPTQKSFQKGEFKSPIPLRSPLNYSGNQGDSDKNANTSALSDKSQIKPSVQIKSFLDRHLSKNTAFNDSLCQPGPQRDSNTPSRLQSVQKTKIKGEEHKQEKSKEMLHNLPQEISPSRNAIIQKLKHKENAITDNNKVIETKKQINDYLNHLIQESTQDQQRDLKSTNLETSLQSRLKVVEATNNQLLQRISSLERSGSHKFNVCSQDFYQGSVSPVMPRRNASSSLVSKDLIDRRERIFSNENIDCRKEKDHLEKSVLMENNNSNNHRNDRKASNQRIDSGVIQKNERKSSIIDKTIKNSIIGNAMQGCISLHESGQKRKTDNNNRNSRNSRSPSQSRKANQDKSGDISINNVSMQYMLECEKEDKQIAQSLCQGKAKQGETEFYQRKYDQVLREKNRLEYQQDSNSQEQILRQFQRENNLLVKKNEQLMAAVKDLTDQCTFMEREKLRMQSCHSGNIFSNSIGSSVGNRETSKERKQSQNGLNQGKELLEIEKLLRQKDEVILKLEKQVNKYGIYQKLISSDEIISSKRDFEEKRDSLIEILCENPDLAASKRKEIQELINHLNNQIISLLNTQFILAECSSKQHLEEDELIRNKQLPEETYKKKLLSMESNLQNFYLQLETIFNDPRLLETSIERNNCLGDYQTHIKLNDLPSSLETIKLVLRNLLDEKENTRKINRVSNLFSKDQEINQVSNQGRDFQTETIELLRDQIKALQHDRKEKDQMKGLDESDSLQMSELFNKYQHQQMEINQFIREKDQLESKLLEIGINERNLQNKYAKCKEDNKKLRKSLNEHIETISALTKSKSRSKSHEGIAMFKGMNKNTDNTQGSSGEVVAELQTIKTRMQELQSVHSVSEQKRNQLMLEKKEMVTALIEAQRQNVELIKANEEQILQNEQLERQIGEKVEQQQVEMEKYEQLMKECQNLKKEFQSISKQKVDISVENQKLKESIQTNQARYQEDIRLIQLQSQEFKQEAKNGTYKIVMENEETINNLKNALKAQETQIKRADDKAKQLENQVKRLEEQIEGQRQNQNNILEESRKTAILKDQELVDSKQIIKRQLQQLQEATREKNLIEEKLGELKKQMDLTIRQCEIEKYEWKGNMDESLKKLEADRRDLREQAEQYKEQNGQLERIVEEVYNKLELAQNENQRIKQDINNLERNLNQSEEQIKELQRINQQVEEVSQVVARERDSVACELKEVFEEFKQANEKIDLLEMQITEMQKLIDSAEEQNEELREERVIMKGQQQILQKQLLDQEALRKQQSVNHEGGISQYQEELSRIQNETQEKEESLKQDIEKIQREYAMQEQMNEQLQQSNDSLEEERRQLLEQLQTEETQTKQLIEELQRVSTESNDQKQQISDYLGKIDELTKQIRLLEIHGSQMEERYQEAEQQWKKEKESLKEGVKSDQIYLIDQSEELQENQKQVQLDNQERQIEQLRQELREQHTDCDRLRKILEESERKAKEVATNYEEIHRKQDQLYLVLQKQYETQKEDTIKIQSENEARMRDMYQQQQFYLETNKTATEQILGLEEEISQYQMKLSESQSDKESLEEILTEWKLKYQSLQETYDTCQKQSINEKQAMNKQNQQLTKELNDKILAIQEQEEQIQQLKEQIQVANLEILDKQKKLSEIERQTNQENAKMDNLNEETDNMKVQLNNQDILLRQLKLQTQKDQEEINVLKGLNEQTEQENMLLNKEIEQVRQQLQEMQASYGEEQQKLIAVANENRNLQTEVIQQKVKIDKITEDNLKISGESDQKFNLLSSELQTQKQLLIDQEVLWKNKYENEKQEEINQMKVQILEVERALKQANQKSTEYKEQYEKECKQLSNKVEELMKERDSLKQQLQTNEQYIIGWNEEKLEYQIQIQDLKLQKEELEKQIKEEKLDQTSQQFEKSYSIMKDSQNITEENSRMNEQNKQEEKKHASSSRNRNSSVENDTNVEAENDNYEDNNNSKEISNQIIQVTYQSERTQLSKEGQLELTNKDEGLDAIQVIDSALEKIVWGIDCSEDLLALEAKEWCYSASIPKNLRELIEKISKDNNEELSKTGRSDKSFYQDIQEQEGDISQFGSNSKQRQQQQTPVLLAIQQEHNRTEDVNDIQTIAESQLITPQKKDILNNESCVVLDNENKVDKEDLEKQLSEMKYKTKQIRYQRDQLVLERDRLLIEIKDFESNEERLQEQVVLLKKEIQKIQASGMDESSLILKSTLKTIFPKFLAALNEKSSSEVCSQESQQYLAVILNLLEFSEPEKEDIISSRQKRSKSKKKSWF